MLVQKLQKIYYHLKVNVISFLKKRTPIQVVLFGFVLVILIGGFLLWLPFSQVTGEVSYLDCLFTAVSATCVTGLVVVNTAAEWTEVGKVIILGMIQIGGLSFVTLFTFIVVSAGKKVNMRSRLLVQASLNQNSMKGMVRIVKLAIKGTLLFEAMGAIILFLRFRYTYGIGFGKSVAYGIFHSVSAFCNAGFDIIGELSLQPFVGDPIINITIMTLIITGGIGFIVWKDIVAVISVWTKKRQTQRVFSLHSKLAIRTTLILILAGSIYFFATEYTNSNTLGKLDLGEKILASIFQSVTLRTAGFFTIAQDALTESSKFVSSMFMLIGGSPGGTAGGVKTVTLAIVVSSVWSTFKGENDIDVLHRRISVRLLQRAIAVIGAMFSLWFLVSTIIEFTMINSLGTFSFMDILFEVASALGTVGLSTGMTPYLNVVGKVLIMLCMFIGRLGPIGIASSLQKKSHLKDDRIRLPKEDVIIG
ncbi:MAG: TrkH family potassium uptake protein [Lachnospiraceae bacterium]